MELKLRKAVKSDMYSVLELIKELAIFENEPEAVSISEQTLIDDGFGEKPAFKVFVAELENKIVGMALFYERYSTWKGKSIHLEDLIVQNNHRGKGIGLSLYTKVLKYAHVNQFKRVAWEVLDWNKVAIDFYKSTGAKVFDLWRVAQIDEISITKYLQNLKSN
ncbi:N-acetyltransferase [hydrothermal vent metagenome]|uniref:N-acetyltransferase n=1 Tax=hydrothermal vent metagenome TaxID=652676 RepID=A0A3B0RLZ2_9ZZZZ